MFGIPVNPPSNALLGSVSNKTGPLAKLLPDSVAAAVAALSVPKPFPRFVLSKPTTSWFGCTTPTPLAVVVAAAAATD